MTQSAFMRDANHVPITGLGLSVTKEITYAALTTGAVAASRLFTVTGDVAIRVFAKCTSDLLSGGAATIEVGISSNSAAFIAQTTATTIDAGEIWIDTSPAMRELLPALSILVDGDDILQTIGTTTITGGTLLYYAQWFPISEDGDVVAA